MLSNFPGNQRHLGDVGYKMYAFRYHRIWTFGNTEESWKARHLIIIVCLMTTGTRLEGLCLQQILIQSWTELMFKSLKTEI